MSDSFPVLDGAAFFADPHRVYAQLREKGPVVQVISPSQQKVWIVLGHAEARTAMADPRFSKDTRVAQAIYERFLEPSAANDRSFSQSLTAHMLNTDPPEHTRLRRLVSAAFTPRMVEQLQPRVEDVTAQLIAQLRVKLAGGAPVDLLEEFATPLAIAIISDLLGIAPPARSVLRSTVTDLMSVGDTGVIDRASQTLAGLLMQTLAAKREQPGADLLTALIAEHDGDRLTDRELVSMAMLLVIAGHETTVNVIGNGVLALLENSDAAGKLAADSAAVPAAVEELLRYDGPVNMATFRFTTEAVDLGGIKVPAEHPVIVSPLAANRDPARFNEPHLLQLDRDARGHVAFGYGVHHCIGAALARMEATIAMAPLLELLSEIRLACPADQLRWRRSALVRGLEELPIATRSTA